MRHQNPAGKTAKVTYPSDELQDAFYQVGMELEKAFTMAAQETQAAFKKVSDNMQQKIPRHNPAAKPHKEPLFAPTAEPKTLQAQSSATTAANA